MKLVSRMIGVIVGLTGCVFSLAGTMGEISKPKRCFPIATFTAGSSFSRSVGKTQNFPASDTILSFFDYSNGGATFNQYLLGGSIGAECSLNSQWSVQSGVSYYQPGKFTASGAVTQGIDLPSANSYAYQYQVLSRQVLAESKLLYHWLRTHPYLSGGLGAGFNAAQNFSVNIQPPFTTFSNQFANSSSTSYSYNVGAGIDYDLMKYVRVGVGYRFSDYGTIKTGPAVIDDVVSGYQLRSAHLYTNSVQAQISLLWN